MRRHRHRPNNEGDSLRSATLKFLISTLCGVLAALLCAPLAAGQDVSKFDLSTNDGVNAAREAISGRPLEEHSKGCIRRDASLPRIVVVGGFAFDYGCRLQGAFVKTSYLAADKEAFSRTALEALGWKTGKRAEREKLAMAWVSKGLLGFLTIISNQNEDFANHAFQPPKAITGTDASSTVTLWIRLPAGRVRGTTYQKREYKFSSEGNLSATNTLDNFTTSRN